MLNWIVGHKKGQFIARKKGKGTTTIGLGTKRKSQWGKTGDGLASRPLFLKKNTGLNTLSRFYLGGETAASAIYKPEEQSKRENLRANYASPKRKEREILRRFEKDKTVTRRKKKRETP